MKTNIMTDVIQEFDRPYEGTASVFRFSCPDCGHDMECTRAEEVIGCLCGRTWKLVVHAMSEVEDGDDELEDDDGHDSSAEAAVTWGDFKLAVDTQGVRDDQVVDFIDFWPAKGRASVAVEQTEEDAVFIREEDDEEPEDGESDQ